MLEIILFLLILPAVLSGTNAKFAARMGQAGGLTDESDNGDGPAQDSPSGLPAVMAGGLPGLLTAIAAIGVTLAFCVAFAGIRAVPPFPPGSSTDTLFYAPMIATGLLVLVCLFKPLTKSAIIKLTMALSIAGIGWVAWRVFDRLDAEASLSLALSMGAMLIAGFSTLAARNNGAHLRGAYGVFALGLAIVMILGGTATSGFYLIALAVAIAVSALFEPAFSRSGAAVGVAAAALLTIGPIFGQAVLYTDVDTYALAVTPLSFLGLFIGRRLGLSTGDGFFGSLKVSLVQAVLCAAPLAAAVAITYVNADSGYGY